MRPTVRLFAIIGGVALLVRLVAVLVPRLTAPYQLHGDAPLYDEIARGLLAGQGFQYAGHQTAVVTPGYPVFLAAVYVLAGGDLLAVGVVQALMGAATAGLIAAVYPHFAIWTEQVLTETLFVFLAVLALWMLVETPRHPSLRWSASCAAVIALDALVRPELLAFVPLAAVVAAAFGIRRHRAWRSVLLIAIPALVMGAWILRNTVSVGVPSASTQSASVMWLGYNPQAARLHSGGYVYAATPLPDADLKDPSEAATYARYSQAVAEFIKANPQVVVTFIPAKMINMWRPVFEGSKPITWLLFGGSYLTVMILVVVGAITAWRDGAPAELWYLYAYVAALVAVHALTIAEIWYRMPTKAELIAVAGIGAAATLRRFAPAPIQREIAARLA